MAVTDSVDLDDQSAPGTMTKSELIARLAERYPQLVAKDAEPKPPRITEMKERFMARHMM